MRTINLGKHYQYKIQWLFENSKNAKKAIDILGARSLDKICFRDMDLNLIDEYRGFIQYFYGLAEVKTKKYIDKMVKNDKRIVYIELLRK